MTTLKAVHVVSGGMCHAVAVMGMSQFGAELTDQEIDWITGFLQALVGDHPQVTYPILLPSVATTPRPEP